jgi:hypothetical protein
VVTNVLKEPVASIFRQRQMEARDSFEPVVTTHQITRWCNPKTTTAISAVDKMALGHVFSETLISPDSSHSATCSIFIITLSIML